MHEMPWLKLCTGLYRRNGFSLDHFSGHFQRFYVCLVDSSLFGWLVNRVNSIINKGERFLSINILDIFGFEDFPVRPASFIFLLSRRVARLADDSPFFPKQENSFEQMCINYANENLQFYFNKHIFKLEQLEYAKEKIQWQNISFTDNQPVISLIAKKPIGIFHLLDDESNFPKATDASFLEKCHYNHALNELYFRPRMSSMEFGVKHYAGQVNIQRHDVC